MLTYPYFHSDCYLDNVWYFYHTASICTSYWNSTVNRIQPMHSRLLHTTLHSLLISLTGNFVWERKTTPSWLHAQNHVYIVTFDLYCTKSSEPQVLSTKAADTSLYQNMKLSDPERSHTLGLGVYAWQQCGRTLTGYNISPPDTSPISQKYPYHHTLIISIRYMAVQSLW